MIYTLLQTPIDVGCVYVMENIIIAKEYGTATVDKGFLFKLALLEYGNMH